MTTFDPGARLVFTHGLLVSPFATAFFASTPAAIITDGFDVFVQLVMAAMTTDPSVSTPPGISTGSTTPGAAIGSGGSAFLAAALSFGSASANDAFTSLSATRSCGRLGPARLGSTVPRSSSSVSV